MVWQKGATLNGADGAGHVAIVEKVINDTEVYTSESAYGGTAFRNATRKKGSDGKWGMGSDYKFLGFIYNPAPCCSDDAKADNSGGSTVTDTSLTFKVGDVVQFTGGIHYSSAGAANGPSCKPGKAKVTATSKGSKHPYHLIHTDSTSTVYGWVDADKVQAVAEGSNSSSTDIKVGDVVQFAGGPHYISSTAASSSSSPKAGPAKVTAISKGSKHPYHIVHTDGQSSVYGWVDAGKVSK